VLQRCEGYLRRDPKLQAVARLYVAEAESLPPQHGREIPEKSAGARLAPELR
jgi:hypothetical protein